MDAWSCNSCGALIKQKDKPSRCLLCNRRAEFTHLALKEEQDNSSKKYEEALKKLEEYEEGAPPRKLSDLGCGCSKN
jgi:hypothetical protein